MTEIEWQVTPLPLQNALRSVRIKLFLVSVALSDWVYFYPFDGIGTWLVCSTPERAVQIRALAKDIVLCSWARYFTLIVPLSTKVYKWGYWRIYAGGTL